MRTLGLIPARGGSKGIPGKNIKPLAGKPLIAWTIEAALSSARLDRVLVSTDDPEIARVAEQYGAEAPFCRPSEFATDTATQVAVIEHALEWVRQNWRGQPEYLALLQPTSPLRTTHDIDDAIGIAYEQSANAVVSVCEASPHPHLCAGLNEDGTLAFLAPDPKNIARKQDLPQMFCLNGAVYVVKVETLLQTRTVVPVGTYPCLMPPDRSIDIDTKFDLQIAELLLAEVNRKCASAGLK